MRNLTYDMYISNPAVRSQLERQVRRMRAEAVQAFFAAVARAIFSCTPAVNLKTA